MNAASNLDRQTSLQEFMQKKFIIELKKGVASMHQFVHPTVLQSAAIPVIKKSDSKNIIVRYSELSGIKLTLLLPLVNQQIQHVIKQFQGDEKQPLTYSLFLCHTNQRCSAMAEFARELTKFAQDVVDIVTFDQLDFQDIKHDWSQRTKKPDEEKLEEDEKVKAQIKSSNKVLFVTPSTAQTMFGKGILSTKNAKCFGLVVDKINMHQAFDLDQDLIELS